MIESGTVLQNRFLIEKELAHGGMGAVYLATDQKFGSRVAIKERFYEDAQLAEAFAREARILNSLHHPMLPYVSDYFSEGDGQFLVMEYIEGEDLSEILKREGKAFPVTDVIRWMLELLDGLDFLHSQDPPIVHRDIKPGNLKLTSRGNLVLLDFGLAKETAGNNQGIRSVFGYSRRYSPLEQIEGAGTSPRSDIFSLGATAYHLVTGQAPPDVLARASAIVAGRPDPLRLASEINAVVNPSIANAIHRAMSLDPGQRFATAGEMQLALHQALEDKVVDKIGSEVTDVIGARVLQPPIPSALEPVLQSDMPVQHVSGTAQTFSDPRQVQDNGHRGTVTEKRYNGNSSGWRSSALAAVVVLFALLAIGYLVADFRSPVETGQEAVSESETVNIDEVPASAENQEASRVEDRQPDRGARQSDTLASAPRDLERPVKGPKGPEARRAEPEKREVAKEREDEETVRSSSVRKRTVERKDRYTSAKTARTPQRRNSYESPVSSIEMIFTGIAPEQQRRSRRSQPY